MELEIDYNPTPKDTFFVSVALNDKEVISFDYTLKGCRITKQIFVEKKPFPKDKAVSSEWETLVLRDGKLVEKYHAKWIDMDELDWVNDQVWKTVWLRPMTEDLKEKILHYSHLISDNYNKLENFSNEMEDFENLLSESMETYDVLK